MAVFVDLDDDDDDDMEPPQDISASWPLNGDAAQNAVQAPVRHAISMESHGPDRGDRGSQLAIRENPNWNSLTGALGCYP
jgi:hypothetical protein